MLDHLWPEIWSSMSIAEQTREKQQWSIEKSTLDNSRKLRGICFIDPEDKEFKETIFFFKKKKKKRAEKLELPIEAQLCFASWRRSGIEKPVANPTKSENQSMHVSLKMMSLRENVWKGTLLKDHEDPIAEKGFIESF